MRFREQDVSQARSLVILQPWYDIGSVLCIGNQCCQISGRESQDRFYEFYIYILNQPGFSHVQHTLARQRYMCKSKTKVQDKRSETKIIKYSIVLILAVFVLIINLVVYYYFSILDFLYQIFYVSNLSCFFFWILFYSDSYKITLNCTVCFNNNQHNQLRVYTNHTY